LPALGQRAQHQIAVLQRRRAHAQGQIQPSPITSTRRLVSSTCSSTRGYWRMNSPSMRPTREASKATGQLMRTLPQGSECTSATDSSAASASVSMARQCW
jgi:hypothetical protein